MPPLDQNPYASPTPEDAPLAGDFTEDLRTLAWRIILAWEKLRLAYLGWLSVVSLGVLAALEIRPEQFRDWRFWLILIVGFVGANVCFSAGHVAEISLAALGMPAAPRQWLRRTIFVLGTLFATALTIAFLFAAAAGAL